MSNLPALPPVMTVENITSLMGYLETKSQDVKFPSLSVFPDFLSSILRFVNERNRIWREDVQFNAKMAFARETVDKQLLFAVQKLNEQTKLQIASVQGDVQTRLARINQEYDVAIQRLEKEYDLKRKEMREYYDLLERYRQDQGRRFDAMIVEVKNQRGEMRKCINEIAAVSRHIQNRILNNTATSDDRNYYLLLMQMRLDQIKNMGEAVCVLASKVK